MKNQIQVIIKTPTDQIGCIKTIDNTLEALQKIVGGYIEAIYIQNDVILIVNEDGKYSGLDKNFKIPNDTIVGTVIVCSSDEEDFSDITISLNAWEQLLKKWGN